MFSVRVSVPAGLLACSVTFTSPSAVGIPESTPVAESNESHCGNPFTESCGSVPEAVTA